MSRARTAVGAVLSLVLAGAPDPALAQAPAPPAAADPDVARGIRQVDEGDYDAAIVTLDTAVRKLASQPGRQDDLAQAYLHLGVAYLAKGHETSARARFRDAIRQARNLSPSTERFAPRVIELFEKAREEVGAPAPAPSPAAAVRQAAEKKGGSKGLLLAGVGLAAAAGVAVAVSGGGSSEPDAPAGPPGPGGLRQTAFPNETLNAGAGKDFVVNVTGTGQLTAKVNWQPVGVLLDMYIVALSNSQRVLMTGSRTATTEVQLTLPVTAQAYRISVTHSSGQGAQVPATFTLTVQHP